MSVKENARLLRIFTGESDRVHHQPLYEAIVTEAHKAGMAGATAWRGIMSYGPSSKLHTANILDLASDLPVIIEITDNEEKIDAFLPRLDALFDASRCGGLVTIEEVKVVRYRHGDA